MDNRLISLVCFFCYCIFLWLNPDWRVRVASPWSPYVYNPWPKVLARRNHYMNVANTFGQAVRSFDLAYYCQFFCFVLMLSLLSGKTFFSIWKHNLIDSPNFVILNMLLTTFHVPWRKWLCRQKSKFCFVLVYSSIRTLLDFVFTLWALSNFCNCNNIITRSLQLPDDNVNRDDWVEMGNLRSNFSFRQPCHERWLLPNLKIAAQSYCDQSSLRAHEQNKQV